MAIPTTLIPGTHLEQQHSLPNIPIRPVTSSSSGTSIADRLQNPPKPSAPGIVSPEQPMTNDQHSLNANEDQHGPLPEGWESGIDPLGLTYYVNHHTRSITRNHPASPNQVVGHQAQEDETTFGDAFGLNGTQTDSALGTASSQTSSIPPTQPPVSTVSPTNPVRGTISPRETVSLPVSRPFPASPPPQMASPKGRLSTPSSNEIGKEHGTRHSKLAVSEHSPPPGIEKMTFVPIIDPSMRFSRSEAVAALEANSYDFQKALHSLSQ